jgi:hypothetical protein
MKRLVLLFLAASAAFAQYKLEPITTPAPDVPAAYAPLLDTHGYRVTGPKGAWCEVWFRKSIPAAGKPSDSAIVFPFAQGTLLGVIHFPAAAADRRGQTIKPGVYTFRYSDYPVDGAHQGVAPQRDFALLTPIAGDPDPNATPDFKTLVQNSTKASGTPHPAVFSMEAPQGSDFPSVAKEGDNDWVLNVKVGDTAIGLIVVGQAQG